MRALALLLCLLALAAGLSGCTSSDGGSASVYVKDAPTDEFDEIHIVFTRVEVHAAGTDGADDENSTAGWATVFENETGLDVELLATAGDGTAAFLGETDLSAGRYTQIRIHTTEAYGIQNGTRVDFELANGILKVVKPFEVSADAETRIVVEIDLDRSLREQGARGWRLTPVVGTTTTEQVEDGESGEDVDTPGEPTGV